MRTNTYLVRTTLAFAVVSTIALGAAAARPASAVTTVESCTLVGGARAPAQLRVYVELPSNAKGGLLWNGTIGRGQRVGISTPTGRIIYDYRYDDRDTWKEENHTWCHRNADEKVP